MPFGYGVWLFLKNNPAARWAAGIGAAFIAFLTWLALHDRKVRREAVQKQETKARKTATKELTKLEHEADERIEKAHQAADAVSGDVDSGSLSDDTRRILFGD